MCSERCWRGQQSLKNVLSDVVDVIVEDVQGS
jgi:hypothetical protein